MLLLHQAGSVKIGEVVRYTVTYTPADDRILPSPPFLYLKIKNTSALPLRAAFVHGPYALYVSSCPATFQPNEKFENPRRDGVPEFEHNLKAGATWFSQLHVPEYIRETAGSAKSHLQRRSLSDENPTSVSWIIEVASQVIFSNSATVHYEVLLGRDEKSLSLGFAGLTGSSSATPAPGQVSDHQQSQGAKDGHHNAQAKGVYSRAIKLKVEDTASLWNTPQLPQWDDGGVQRAQMKNADAPVEKATSEAAEKMDDNNGKKQKKVHLVILTHGLHSNLGADMLYLKESIDAGAKQAKIDARARKNARREEAKKRSSRAAKAKHHLSLEMEKGKVLEESPLFEEPEEDVDDTDDEEEVIVRGFSGNAVRTEKGIKYLGKRLAKYILATTYPDQPFLPIGKNHTIGLATTTKSDSSKDNGHHLPVHSHSTIHRESYHDKKLAYKITSISFIAHSLGGLIQTYAVAYVQKHSPHFFDTIRPINFIAMASPFLGLSNENPLYVKFALDFGFVGRTGQDLGLTWRPPTIARSGWGAIVSGMSEKAHKKAEEERDPGSKPLLRILPTGPAHMALKKFRNRTLYSNVVNDGIVPLRTSCLLFLDWQGLDRVEKARRENGLVGTVAGLAWAEITGASSSTSSRRQWMDKHNNTDDASDTDTNSPTRRGKGAEVPQPPIDATDNDDTRSLKRANSNQDSTTAGQEDAVLSPTPSSAVASNTVGPLDSILGLFRTNPSPKPHPHPPKYSKIYKRSQTINFNDASSGTSTASSSVKTGGVRDDSTNLSAPPKTTIFESAGDILSPPVPSISFLIDPASRPRTIFHDRVYHPADIPPPPTKRPTRSPILRRLSSSGSVPQTPGSASTESASSSRTNSSLEGIDSSSMKVEEKIARAYHRDLSWRKVLVRLEPDAHNNMIVRRRFANAYGWPVVKHLVDTHFSDSVVAAMRDDDEDSLERAKDMNEKPTSHGSETKDPAMSPVEAHRFIGRHVRTESEARESSDHVPPLGSKHITTSTISHSAGRPNINERKDSAQWSDRDFVDSEEDSDGEESEGGNANKGPGGTKAGWNWTEAIVGKGSSAARGGGTSKKEIDAFLGKRPADVAQTKSTENLEAGANGSVDARRAAAEGFGAGTTTVGLGKNLSAGGDANEGVSEQVARMSLGTESAGGVDGDGRGVH